MINQLTDAFFELLRAGLWETDIKLSQFNEIDFNQIYEMAIEQSVVGVIAAGLEHICDEKPPKEVTIRFVGDAIQMEWRSAAMNSFIGNQVEKLRNEGIHPLLLKGQGIAQCYERPFWRASGDIDFYLDEDGFKKAKYYYRPLVSSFDPDNEYARSINMHYDQWIIEIHANQHCGLSRRIDQVLDEIHKDCFIRGAYRVWKKDLTEVRLPSPDNDVILVFTHFLKHFYKGGLGFRQVCDWCRLLWTYRDSIDLDLLERRLSAMRLKTEWKAFASLAVNYLGMPTNAMPFYSTSKSYRRKSERIIKFILMTGNMGHNRDTSYYQRYPFLIRKWVSLSRRIHDVINHSMIFPSNSVRFLSSMVSCGLQDLSHGF